MIRSTVSRAVRRDADGSAVETPDLTQSESFLRSVRRGAVGGLIATLVMTIYRLPVFQALPPTAEFWAKYAGDGNPEHYPVPAALLHLLYGTTAGALFGALFSRIRSDAPVRRQVLAVLAGIGYGILLSVVGDRVLLDRLLGMDIDPDRELVFYVGHVVYGLTLGTWFATDEHVDRRNL